MNKRETELYRQIRNVPGERSLEAARAVMHAEADRRFKAENDALRARRARLEPVHTAMRAVLATNKEFAAVQAALVAAPRRLERPAIKRPFAPPGPKAPRLKLGSAHLVDTPPFQELTWDGYEVFSGSVDNPWPARADGATGDMSFTCHGGGTDVLNDSTDSKWAAIGQTYVTPPEVAKEGHESALFRFSASPSFNWEADWSSFLWRQASGNLWIGQVVNRFDSDWTLVDTPVSNQISLESWTDESISNSDNRSGSSSSFGLSTSITVFPNFFYNCWVWIGGSAHGDSSDAASSYSVGSVSANVSSLVFDTFF
jgi:hypothetical protein